MSNNYELPNWSLVLDKIYPTLKRSRKKAAQFFMKERSAAAQMTIGEVAEAAGVSISTVERLSRDLGYKRYADFRVSLSIEANNLKQQQLREIGPDDTTESVKQKVFENHIMAIQSSIGLLDIEQLDKAVKLICESNHIEIYGIGGSGVVVNDAAHKFLRMGVKCHAITDTDLQVKYASLLQPGDVVIAVSYSGRSKSLLDNVFVAKQRGASIIAITGYGKSPLGRIADALLCSCSSKSGFFGDLISTRIAQLTVLDTLFLCYAITNYEKYEKMKMLTQSATARLKR